MTAQVLTGQQRGPHVPPHLSPYWTYQVLRGRARGTQCWGWWRGESGRSRRASASQIFWNWDSGMPSYWRQNDFIKTKQKKVEKNVVLTGIFL